MNTEAVTSLIPPSRLSEALPTALPWIDRTLREFGWIRWTLEGIVSGLQCGALQLWATSNSQRNLFVITDLIQENNGLAVRILLGGGQLDENNDFLSQISRIEKWAMDVGAKSIVVEGRMGWKKLLAPHGYRLEAATFRHTFSDRMN